MSAPRSAAALKKLSTSAQERAGAFFSGEFRATIGAAAGGVAIGEGAHTEFRLLGPMEALRNGESLPLGGAKQRAVLARLLLTPKEPVAADALVEDVWGASPPSSAAHSVQVYVSSLRKVLGKDALVRTGGGYVAAVDPESVDAVRFEALVAKARRASPGRVGPLLREALALWHGPALADFRYESFAQPAIAQLEEARLTALEEAFEDELARGGGAEQVAELQALVAEHPLRERLRRQLILALYRAGRQADALDVYQETRRALVDELGIDPSPELQELYRRVLNQDETLAPEARRSVAPSLPQPLTRFVGRERELEELDRLLAREDVRLVTLTGPGGTGKTRLAVATATRLVGSFPDGAVFVPLAAVTEADGVTTAIADAVGAPAEQLPSALSGLCALLVLDNVEQIAGGGHVVVDVLGAAPGVKAVVTSRSFLHVSGEHEYPVPPLPAEDAVVLFVDRAESVQPDFRPDEAVADICRRLDGLPLAIELAAARTKLLAPEALRERLDRRLSLLTGGAHDLPERQRTLRATMEWSHDLLGADEQRLFARLGVFAGGFTLEAVEEVCEADLDVLASLVDKSLVRALGGRFDLLETIREYAVERLEESGEGAVLYERHARWALRLVEELEPRLVSHEDAEMMTRLAEEHANVLAALERADAEVRVRIAGGVWRFWFVRGQLRDGLARLEAALEAARGIDPAVRSKAIRGAGVLAHRLGDVARARGYMEENLRICEEMGDRLKIASAASNLGIAAESEGDYEEARRLFEQACEIAREEGDTRILTAALGNLSDLAETVGDHVRAEALARESLALDLEDAEGAGDQALAISYLNVGVSVLRQGRAAEAEEPIRTSLGLSWGISDLDGVAYALESLGDVERVLGDPRRAARFLGLAERLRAELGTLLRPKEAQEHDDTRAALAAVLGAEELEAALAEARRLDLGAVVEDALGPRAAVEA